MTVSKVTPDVIEFILWSKNENWTWDQIQQYLKEQAKVKVSRSTIRRHYDKNIDKLRYTEYKNPFDKTGELNMENLSNNTDNTFDNYYGDDDSSTFFATSDLEEKLKTVGIKPNKVKQIAQTFDNTNGTSNDLLWTLDVAGVSPPLQKQIIAMTFGKPTVAKIWPATSTNEKRKKTKEDEVKEKSNTAGYKLGKILDDTITAKQKEFELKRVQDLLSGIDAKKDEDPLRVVKEIFALKALQGKDDSGDNKLIDKIILDRVTKNDSTIVDAMRVIGELQNNSVDSDKMVFQMMHEELKSLREQGTKDKDNSNMLMLELQNEKLNTFSRLQEMQDKTIDKIMTLQMEKVSENHKLQQDMLEKLKQSEIDKLKIQFNNAKERYEGSIRSEEDMMENLLSKGQILEQMGLYIPANKAAPQDEQHLALARLDTVKDLALGLPGQIRESVSQGLTDGISQLNQTMIQLMEFQLKREKVFWDLQERRQQVYGQPQTPSPPPQRTNRQRNEALNNLEAELDRAMKAKKKGKDMDSIDNELY